MGGGGNRADGKPVRIIGAVHRHQTRGAGNPIIGDGLTRPENLAATVWHVGKLVALRPAGEQSDTVAVGQLHGDRRARNRAPARVGIEPTRCARHPGGEHAGRGIGFGRVVAGGGTHEWNGRDDSKCGTENLSHTHRVTPN